ncbi:MAG: DUF2798 domain-containing protein [Oscillospiraceae bacterium]|nr:DUF2798 domain-containing protein [Oscillospiraceae bacterium]
MPQTKTERLVFGTIMSMLMALCMEIYNVAWQMGYATQPGGLGTMDYDVLPVALQEWSFMWIIVLVISELWGNPMARKLAGRIIRPEQDNPFFVTLMVSGCTVLVMCPTMSLVGSLIFNIGMGGTPISKLPIVWFGTLLKNFPIALCWQLFAAGPITRTLFKRIFRRQETRSAH